LTKDNLSPQNIIPSKTVKITLKFLKGATVEIGRDLYACKIPNQDAATITDLIIMRAYIPPEMSKDIFGIKGIKNIVERSVVTNKTCTLLVVITSFLREIPRTARKTADRRTKSIQSIPNFG
jgi:hypothetical protein